MEIFPVKRSCLRSIAAHRRKSPQGCKLEQGKSSHSKQDLMFFSIIQFSVQQIKNCKRSPVCSLLLLDGVCSGLQLRECGSCAAKSFFTLTSPWYDMTGRLISSWSYLFFKVTDSWDIIPRHNHGRTGGWAVLHF